MFFETESRKPIQCTVQVLCLAGLIAIFLPACVLQNVPTETASATEIHIEVLPFATGTPIPTTTPRPTPTVTATPTVDAITALASEFNVPAVCLFAYQVSKDRNWIGADCNLYKQLVISNKSSRSPILIPYQEIDAEASDTFSTRPLTWASDNRYFYFTTRCCNNNSNGSLYRFDVGKKSWDILVHAAYQPFYFFSSDGERYVYLNHTSSDNYGFPTYLEIGMVDVSLNKNKRVVLKYYWGPIDGQPNYVWSRKGDQFAIVLEKLIAVHAHTIDSDKVLLKTDFNLWKMELVEQFDSENLLGE